MSHIEVTDITGATWRSGDVEFTDRERDQVIDTFKSVGEIDILKLELTDGSLRFFNPADIVTIALIDTETRA